MARIAGINIPQNKIVRVGLTYIYGIGNKYSQEICKNLNIPSSKRVNQLTDDEILKIREYIDKNIDVEGELRRETSLNIKRYSEDDILNLIRPLINTKKDELIYISKKIFKFYFTDPSNFNEKFLRTKIRNYLDKFKLDGLDINKIKLTLSNLQSANESINFYKEKSIKNHVRYLQRNACFVNYDLFNYESEEVVFRTVSDIISKISGHYYPPRGKDVKNLITRMQSKKFKKSTLGGCIIEKTYNSIIFRKEFGA